MQRRLVAAARWVMIGALLTTAFAGSAAAERLPRPPAPAVQASGSIAAPTIDGSARLDTPTTITAHAAVTLPFSDWRTQGTITVSAGGQSCSATMIVLSGAAELSVPCEITATAADLGQLPVTVTVRTASVRDGVTHTNNRSARIAVPIADGFSLAPTAAKAQWLDLRDRLQELAAPTATPSASAAAEQSEAVILTAANAASALYTQAQRSGWASSATQARMADLRALRNSDGGYGLNAAWDAYSDGSINPANTTYTVTTAGHVGWVLIEAVKHGQVMREDLDRAIDALLATRRLTASCLAYSTSMNDATRPCVYNVNLASGAFLVQARALTAHRSGEVDRLITAIRSGIRNGYNPSTGYWVYLAGNTTGQDIGHQLYSVRMAQVLDPSFDVLSVMMARPWWQQPNGMSQTALALSSAMVDVARDCRFARSPAVLLGARRALDIPSLQSSTLSGLQMHTNDVITTCFP